MSYARNESSPTTVICAFASAVTLPQYRGAMPWETALVGREKELARLRDSVEQVMSGTGQAVLVEGEPGIGKSSVVKAVAELGVRRGCQVYWASSDELGRDLPLRPLIDALRVPELAGEHRLATIGRLLRGEHTSGVAPTVAASEQMLTLITELCGHAPTILVVDDLQWSDTATISVWKWLARTTNRTSLLLIGITRPVPHRDELTAIRRAVGADGTVRLDGLSNAAATELVAHLSEGQPGADLLRLAAGAGGNPLYLTELVAALARANRLAFADSGVVEVSGGPVPDSLLGVIADRLDFVPPNARVTLRASALLGGEFPVSDLAIVLNERVADLVEPIEIACASGILESTGDKLTFRHPLIRTALYDDIPEVLRAAWHRDAATAMAAAGVPVERVGLQLFLSVRTPGAGPMDESLLDWLVTAAPTFVAQVPEIAVDLLGEACRHAPVRTARGAVLRARLAEALFRAGDGNEAERVASQVLLVVRDSGLAVDLYWTVAQCRALAGRTEESLAELNAALASPDMTERQRARLLVSVARAHRALGEVSVAGMVANRALTAAETAGDRWAVGWSLHMLIVVAMMGGDAGAALPLFERALGVVGDDPALIDLSLLLQINKAVALGDLDRYDEALAAARLVRDRADESGILVRLAQAQSALGELLFEVGRWDDAQTEVETLADDFKDPGVRCCDRGVSAVIAFRRGDRKTAREHLAVAADSAELIGSRVVASLTLARGLDHEVDGRSGAALAVLTAAVGGEAEELDEMEELLPEAARLAAAVGDDGTARAVAARAVAFAARSEVPHRLGAAAYCVGMRDRDAGRLLAAADHYRAAGRPLLRAAALEAAALLLVHDGDRDAARAAFVDADDLYGGLGAEWDLGRLRAELRRHGFRRGARARQRRARTGWESLTAAEARVAGLVADGLSNRQIAQRLFLSTRTVETHVSRVLGKLAVRSRLDIARAADRRHSP